jgi:serine/threonine-protein kinase
VLPFEDLSAVEDGYFAAGMTEELLSRLAVVHGLLVLSRTTVVNYDRAGKTVPQIGRDLDVDYVLEGTVRWDRSGDRDRVRITPQLIRVSDDTHLWADRYDRDMADIFAVQSDIASQIVRALGVTLSERERRLVEIRPTANLEAYQLYLRGLQAVADGQAGRREDQYLGVTADFMRRATDLDPAFALAHARRAWALAWSHFLGGPAEELAEARSALERAATLAPDRPEVRVATGFLRYWGDGDYTGALAEFEAAAAELPNNGDALIGAGSVLRRLGRYEEAIARFERAGELGGPADMPDVWTAGDEIATCNWALRRYEAVDRYYSQHPPERRETAEYWRDWARLHVQWKGETTSAWELLAQAPATVQARLMDTRALLHVMDRDFARAVASVPPSLLDPEDDPDLVWYVAYAQLRLEHEREVAELGRRMIAVGVEHLTANPDAWFPQLVLGNSYALIGERNPALEHTRRAVDLLARDAFWGPKAKENLALVHTLLGDHEPALDLIAELLLESYDEPLNAQRLRLEPWWDPLRDQPRFQQLLAGAGAMN